MPDFKSIVSKVWNHPYVLKNAGGGHGDYIEKTTYLLFLKLAEQYQIVAEVEARTTAIDHLEAELDRQITRANRLRQATLSDAFCGKL